MKILMILIGLMCLSCASKKSTLHVDNYITQGEFYFKEQNFARSRFYYTLALEKGEGDKTQNLAKLGAIAIKLNQFQDAENYLTQSLELLKTDEASYNLALCYVLLNQPVKALEILNLLYEKDQNDNDVVKLIIFTSMQTNQFQKAFEFFEKLPTKIRKSNEMQPFYVYTLIKLDRIEEADFQMINVKDIDVGKRIMKILKPKLASK